MSSSYNCSLNKKKTLSQTKKAVVFFDIQSTSPMNFENWDSALGLLKWWYVFEFYEVQ